MIGDVAAFHAQSRAFPERGRPAERLRFLLQWAVLAPSRHNTQPWTFEVDDDEVRVYTDASRALRIADPDGRQLVMACGAAIVNLRLAALHFGHASSLELLPAHQRDGLLARVRLEERTATSEDAEELFQAIPRRRTNRMPLDGREPPQGLVTVLLRDARHEGVALRPVDDLQRRAVAEIVAEADEHTWSSGKFRSELAGWTRTTGSARRDGMPGHALGMSDAAAFVLPLLARFSNPAREEAERDRRRALATKALLVLSTPRDGEAEWVAAGEALQRVLLRATAAGLHASFFSQPIEQPDLRRRLADVVGDAGAPQILFRLGYGLEVRPTPRRAVDEVLRRYELRARRPDALAVRTPAPPPFAERAPAPRIPRGPQPLAERPPPLP